MFHKIENRLIVLVLFVLLVFAGTIIYLKLNELNLIQSISDENSNSLKASIVYYISAIREKNLSDDELILRISNATGSTIKIINPDEAASVREFVLDKPYITYALVQLGNNSDTMQKILYAKKESSDIKEK